MKERKMNLVVTTVVSLIVLFTGSSAMAEGNRYNLDRFYHSDVSAASTYVNLFHNSDAVKVDGLEAVLIDVRDVIDILTTNEIIEYLESESEDKTTVEAAIVDELEND